MANSAQTTANTANTNVTAVQAIVATQGSAISAIQALDTVQSSRITALEASQSALGQQVSTNNAAANGGIAAAMALGGTIIPSDAHFALSFNLATYRGQQGFSGSAVIRVSEKVYFNAGVAGSTVKGSTGGRAGVTFAW